MNWAEVSIETKTEGIEILTGFLMVHGVNCVMIEDAEDFNAFLNDTTIHWDYVDDELMKMQQCETKIKFYLADNPQGFEILNQIKADLKFLQKDHEIDLGKLALEISYKEEEEWETAWKKYYHPITISDRLTIVPEWEDYTPKANEKVLLLNPGMAFGTGGHHTTKLCLKTLDELSLEGIDVLDMGCGSGILSIAALLLGAKEVTAIDIDELATKISHENAELNGVDNENFKVYCGNVLDDSTLADKIGEKQYDIIVANIVADVIIAMAPLFKRYVKPDGKLIVSGIIGERAEEVLAKLIKTGFVIEKQAEDNDWVAAIAHLS